MQVNPKLQDAFKLYRGIYDRKEELAGPTCQAHEIVYAECDDKRLVLHYSREGRMKSLALPGHVSMTDLICEHGEGFFKPNRNLMINTASIQAVFPTSGSEYGVSLHGIPDKIFHVSRRQVRALKAIRKEQA